METESSQNSIVSEGKFSATVKGDYIHLITQGKLHPEDIDAPANAALKLAKARDVRKLLDDIRHVDSSSATIQVQSKGFGVLWKLRAFDKVAIIFSQGELSRLFFSTLETMHLNSKFRGFTDEAAAIAWLEEDD